MKELKYLNDKVIKKALAKESKEIRRYIAKLISDVTKIPYEDLKDNLELIYPEVGYNAHIINSITDLVFKDENMYFSIEINYGENHITKIKNLSYVFQLSLRQLKSYHNYEHMQKVIQININSFDPYKQGELLYKSTLMEEKYHIPYSDLISIYEINLEYFKRVEYNEIKKEELLRLLAIFTVEDKKVLKELYEGDEIMESVQREMKGLIEEVDGILYYDEVKLKEAIKREKEREAETRGLERGLKKGLEKGLKKGIQAGIKQRNLELTKKMLEKELDISLISNLTGLTEKEINKLKEKKEEKKDE